MFTTPHLNARMLRWSLALQQYDFAISYVQGKDNIVADFLSRNPEGRLECVRPKSLSIDVLELPIENDLVSCEINNFEFTVNLRVSKKFI